MKVILIGNYGDGNVGDEALRIYFLKQFPDVDWQVVSADPPSTELPRLPSGIRSLVSTPWWRTLGAFWQNKTVVFGGGTLFTDIESIHACFLWWLHAFTAHLLGCRIVFAFQGVGPFRTILGKMLARHAFRLSSSISVRDQDSYNRMQTWNLNTKIIQTFDPAFSLFTAKKSKNRTKNMLIIIPRMNSSPSFIDRARKIVHHSRWDEIIVALLQSSSMQEQHIAHTLQEETSEQVRVLHLHTLEELAELASEAQYVLTQRYHGAIACLPYDVTCDIVPLKPQDKLSSMMPLFELSAGERMKKVNSLLTAGERGLQQVLQ